MLVARLVCSDPSCAAHAEAFGGDVDELAALVCDCGCGLELLGVVESTSDAGVGTVELLLV